MLIFSSHHSPPQHRQATSPLLAADPFTTLAILFSSVIFKMARPKEKKKTTSQEVSQFQTFTVNIHHRRSAWPDSKPSSFFLTITNTSRCSLQPDSQPFLILLEHHTLNSLHHDEMSQATIYPHCFLTFESLVAPVTRTSGT
jgi:hypothetical protein